VEEIKFYAVLKKGQNVSKNYVKVCTKERIAAYKYLKAI